MPATARTGTCGDAMRGAVAGAEANGRETHASLFARQVVTDLAEDLRHAHVECAADRGEQLARGLLATALHLGEVTERNSGRAADVTQGA